MTTQDKSVEQNLQELSQSNQGRRSINAEFNGSKDNNNDYGTVNLLEETNISNKEESCSCKGEKQQKKYIYTIGRVKTRFPDASIENEYRQLLMLKNDTANKTESQVFFEILKENNYLARELCWTFSIENIETYFILPRNPLDYAKLVESLNPNNDNLKETKESNNDNLKETKESNNDNLKETKESNKMDGRIDTDILIGEMGPIAPPTFCSGLILPIIVFDQLYSFNTDQLINAISKPKDLEEESFKNTAKELFERIQQIADNLGATDEHRALNYLSVRYSRIYNLVTEMYAQDYSLQEITVIPSRLIGSRKVLDPIFVFVNRKTDVQEKYFVRVDVTGKYPFLHTKLTRFYDRI